MKQTAMEELWDYIEANYHEENFNLYNAKKLSIEKEKEQIIDSYRDGRSDQQSERTSRFYNRMAEQYYNETFKQD